VTAAFFLVRLPALTHQALVRFWELITVTGTASLLRIVLLVSCAHALVHLLEQSIASVEQVVSAEFRLSLTQSGWLGSALRLPYGLGAMFAGLLADRMGSKRVLTIFLFGGGVVCCSMHFTASVGPMYGQLFLLGSFASMYHPAGLALIANSTTPAERSRALGLHGVLGSLGIASAPFIAGSLMYFPEVGWRGYYVFLGLICGLLAVVIILRLPRHVATRPKSTTIGTAAADDADRLQKLPFTLLIIATAFAGVVYGGFLHFLKRYLSGVQELHFLFDKADSSPGALDSAASYLAAMVLVCGAFGQFFAGRIARHDRLPQLLTLVFLGNAPILFWMSVAEGMQRLVAACVFAFVHFMSQPIYNSLLPQFVPRNKRSTWFGFSNMMGFGVGALGPWLVGSFGDRYRTAYAVLAILACVAATMPFLLWRIQRRASGIPGDA
jgi:MFS transporter, FSR family, fosmidomycin resistance protein